jgi:hypothetical protein
LDDAAGCGVKPVPTVHVVPIELFANPINRSLAVVVVMLGLTTTNDCVPPSLPIPEIASIGADMFDPFTTNTEITNGCANDRFIVTVCPAPTVAFLAYQTSVRKSSPVLVLVGPAPDIQLFPKLSDSVMVTPWCDDAHTTSKSPPVLSNAPVLCKTNDVALMYP